MLRTTLISLLCFNLAFLNPSFASAGLLTVQELTQRGGVLSRQVLTELEKPEAQAKLAELGVSPDEAKLKIAALSDEEIREMLKTNGVQAGGEIFISLTVVLLVVIIVLLIRR